MDEEELRWTEPNDTPGGGTLVGRAVDPADGETDFEPGATLGRYVVLARMGSGGMGVVYAAYDPQLDRRIALKLMHQRGADEAQAEHASRRMLAEAKAMAQLSHPNVITVHDVGTIDGRVFIAMEFVEGVPLTQWMRQAGRDWQQQLEVFIKAGRGLEAAHVVGLIHRDFKPDNVLVGADGRVRVLDFGLARRMDWQDHGQDSGQDGGSGGGRSLQREAGEKRDREAGTPAYMSPEQHLGNPLDHRADQFSFCVALYEALYGEMPFAARTRFELALAVTDGRVGPAPKRATVPNSVRWALLRGLDPDPEGRWPDMASLLSELGRDPYRRMRTVLKASAASLGVLALVVGGVMLVNRMLDEPAPVNECSGAADEIARVWNPEQVTAVHQAFAKVQEPWAAPLAREVEVKLDTWARGWEAMHVATCEATVEGRQSNEMLDRRMLCLERIRAEFGGLLEVMTGAEAESLAQMGEAVAELPALSECEAATVERSSSQSRHEGDSQLLAEQIERDLARARSLELTGAFAQARELAIEAVVRANSIDDQRLVATGLLMQARIEIATGGAEGAVVLLEEAELAAERAGADRLRGDILIAIARLDAEVGNADAANGRVREARAVLDRVDADVVEYAELDGVAALASLAAGESERAEQQVRDAIQSIQSSMDSGSPPVELAQLHATLGLVLRELGRPDARAEFERAAELWTLHYGPQHPMIGRVRFELALVEEREGRHLEAVINYEAASMVFEQVFGADSVVVGRAVSALARNLGELGRYNESLLQYQRARAIFAANGDATSIELAAALDGEGIVQRRLGQPELAVPLHEQALQRLERGGRGVDAVDLADVHVHLGEALLEQERTSEAREQFDAAVRLLAQTSAGQASERRAVVRRMAAGAWASGDDRNVERARELAGLARSEFVTLKAAESVADLDAFVGALAAEG